MIPFGLSSLMTVSLPIGRRATKCLVSGASAIYLFNEGSGTTLTDYSGNGNHGTFAADAAAPTWTQYGISLDGGDYADCGTGLRGLAAGFTAQVVVNVTADGFQHILSNSNGTGAQGTGWFIRKSDGANGYQVRVYNGAGNHVTVYLAGHKNGTWGLVSQVFDGTAITPYAGTTAGTPVACAGMTENTTHPCQIGKDSGSGSFKLIGGVAAALVYPFGLSSGQIARNFAALEAVLAPRGVTLA